MSHPEPDNVEARRLWAQLRASLPPRGPCAPEGDLAAYVEGRMASAARQALETHLAACADCLSAVREARAIAAEAAPGAAPPAVIAAARSLVADPAASGWRISDWLAAGRWVAATAASIAICLVGYRAGTISFVTDGAVGDALASNMSFGVFDADDDDDGLGVLALDWVSGGPEVSP